MSLNENFLRNVLHVIVSGTLAWMQAETDGKALGSMRWRTRICWTSPELIDLFDVYGKAIKILSIGRTGSKLL